MKIGLVTHMHTWGGHLKNTYDFKRGLESIGVKVLLEENISRVLDTDVICFLGTFYDQHPHMRLLQLLRREYICVPFHEDERLYFRPCDAFYFYVLNSITRQTKHNHAFSYANLTQRPDLIFYFDFSSKRRFSTILNHDFLKNAKFVIPGASTEERTLLRDVPECKCKLMYWAPGFVQGLRAEPDDSFLKLTGLTKDSYVLQVGRIEHRKNQLATLLATLDFDIPVVFIASQSEHLDYIRAFYGVLYEKRKAPVWVIAQNPDNFPHSHPNLKIIAMPAGKLLTEKLLQSAFANAGLHLHPSFYELPGYTYLESAYFGIPTIASEWGSLQDYFTDTNGLYTMDDRVEYALPYDVGALKKLVEKKFGQKYPISNHPIYQRTAQDMARDFLKLIQ